VWDFMASYGHGWLKFANLYSYPADCPPSVPGCIAVGPSPPAPPNPPPRPPSPPSPPPPPPSTVVANQLAALRSGALQMNGVNLGGWLALESFLSPEMFVNASTSVPYGSNPPSYGVKGEYQLCADAAQQDAADSTHQLAVTARLRQAFVNHRNTFVTQADFALLASLGINAVRIPVGYWLFANTSVRAYVPYCHDTDFELPAARSCALRAAKTVPCGACACCATDSWPPSRHPSPSVVANKQGIARVVFHAVARTPSSCRS